MEKIHRLYVTHDKLTAEATLEAAKQDNYKNLLVMGYDAEGKLHMRCHNTTNERILWLAKQLEMWALDE